MKIAPTPAQLNKLAGFREKQALFGVLQGKCLLLLWKMQRRPIQTPAPLHGSAKLLIPSTMSPINRDWYEVVFELAMRKKRGEEFQDFSPR